jgi:hypothetical protein
MALVRVLEVENFRAVKGLRWLPGPGVNCLIGPGDGGKSTILDAIDLCLGARRSLSFTDADFHALDFSRSIRIALTLGALDDPLKNIDTYGDFLVGFDPATGSTEPAHCARRPRARMDAYLPTRPCCWSDTQSQLGRSHAYRSHEAWRHWGHASDVAARVCADQAHRWQDERIKGADAGGS